MANRRGVIEIAVRERFLWVGEEAYPLHNIARVWSTPVRPDVRRALGRFLATCAFGVLVGMAGAYLSGMSAMGGALFLIVAFVGLLVLIITLARRTRYGLIVETTGPPYALIVSRDEAQVGGLVKQIAHAINNPQAEFHYVIENLHFGDNITQIGDRNSVHKR
ncbi:DUF6232 family protein [Actinokineospora sp. UTMC 2448]|uniref:DUF6232 family protein n=1 Tax=Actinokineospora sp. UTMC 2448 TaxID=2268449 RepID=UPI002164533E|nr:DUF6232 family protein [Actinokineospora sp. UTMC 2448]UVS76966.1 hypothetical protein Actkin_00664 [Actinokineospora sp. UTMC 2448]